MPVRQFRYSKDNFSYVVYGQKEALVIDGGAVEAILDFTQKQNLRIRYVVNTHDHYDHTIGNEELLYVTKASYLDHHTLVQRKKLFVDDIPIGIHSTPGHTEDSKTFFTENALITGDTLFNATVGNCFSDDLAAFFHSITFLMSFPQKTWIYAGHDYVRQSLVVARLIEPGNSAIESYEKKYNPRHVCYTLSEELSVNPYLRFNTKSIRSLLKEKKLPEKTDLERWESTYALG